jgi:hypothetical protein
LLSNKYTKKINIMAKKTTVTTIFKQNSKRKRKGVHAKTKTTKNKRADKYKKSYVGQGK